MACETEIYVSVLPCRPEIKGDFPVHNFVVSPLTLTSHNGQMDDNKTTARKCQVIICNRQTNCTPGKQSCIGLRLI